METEFVPFKWLEHAASVPGLIAFSYPVKFEK